MQSVQYIVKQINTTVFQNILIKARVQNHIQINTKKISILISVVDDLKYHHLYKNMCSPENFILFYNNIIE